MAEAQTQLPPLVDRQEEVARIAEALDSAERGEGPLLLLRGEAGCGKTRLLQEAAAEAARRGFAAGFGTALSESVVPYHPWKEALAGLGLGRILEEPPPPKLLGLYMVTGKGAIAAQVERDGSGPPPAAVSALCAHARGTGPSEGGAVEEGSFTFLGLETRRGVLLRADGFRLAAIVEGCEDEAFLADLQALAADLKPILGEPARPRKSTEGPRAPAEAVLRGLLETGKYEGIDFARDDPKLRQARLFDQVALGIARRARSSPQLVAVDDLQWADPSSLSLLQYVTRNVRGSRVLLVGVYRVEEAGVRPYLKDALAEMEQERLPAGILVPGLPSEDMRRLAAVFLGPHALPGEFLDLLWRETQGYPLFVREVLRGLELEGAIRLRGAAKRLERPIGELAIPTRVREAIRLRLQKLPKDERRLIDAAAACGTRFTTALLAKVVGEEEGRVLRGLEDLVRVHGLLRPTGNGYGFDHPAVQEVAYEASPAEARRAHHREAAAWLELVGGPVEDVADHLYRAGDERAAPKLREAAEGARARYANAEAIRFYTEALSLQEDPDKSRELLEAMGFIQWLVGDSAAGLASYTTALGLAKSNRDRARMLAEMANIHVRMGQYDAALKLCTEALPLVEGDEVAEEALVFARTGDVCWRKSDYDKALECYTRSLAIREEIGDRPGIAASLHGIGTVHSKRGDYDQALVYYGRAVPISEGIGHLLFLANHLGNIGSAYASKGDYDQALEYFGRAVAIREKIGDRGNTTELRNIGIVYFNRGDYDKALEYCQRSLDIQAKSGNQPDMAESLNIIGAVLGDRGDYDKALEYCQRSLDIREKIGEQYGVALSLHYIGDVYFKRGDYDKALEYCQRSLDIREKIGEQRGVAVSLRGIGHVHGERGDYDRAIGYYRRSLDIQEKIGDRRNMAETLAGFAEVSLRNGDLADAESCSEGALTLATEVGDRVLVSMALRVRGMLRRKQERWQESVADFEESLRILAQVGCPFGEAKTHYEFGLMWNDRGERKKARDHLSKAVQIFDRIGAKGELRRAKDALGTLG